MDNRPDISLAEQFGAALAWWRDAGVDCDFVDEVHPWLGDAQDAAPAEKSNTKPVQNQEVERVPAITATPLPENLDQFRAWWTSADSPLPAGPGPRLGPRGEQGAKLMLLVPMPEAEDRDALLSGPHGTMLANIAKALNIAPGETYCASALPTHMPLPDWDALAAEGLCAALLRHVELAAPERIIVFGTRLPALLGHAASPETLSGVAGIPAIATFAPERLLDHKRQRARLWERLQQWIAP